jgi:hypothetical protein
MRIVRSWLLLALTGVASVSCSGDGDDEDSFVVPTDAVAIGTTGLYLSHAQSATMPTPTQGANAPRVMGVSAHRTGDHSFAVQIDVESTVTIAYAFFDFGVDGVFKVPTTPVTASANSSDKPLTACGVAASSQGITCTSACLSACSCLSCSDDDIERNTEQACALTCSIADKTGSLDLEPYSGSEDKFASILYKGDATIGLPGLASQVGCGTGACVSVSLSTPRKSYAVEFQTPTVPQATPMFAPQVASSDVAQVSQPGAPAKLNVCSSIASDACPPRS